MGKYRFLTLDGDICFQTFFFFGVIFNFLTSCVEVHSMFMRRDDGKRNALEFEEEA